MIDRLKLTLVLLLSLFFLRVAAQTAEERQAFANIEWNTLVNSTGMTCKQASCNLFNTNQHITYVEFSPDYFRLELCQPEYRETPAAEGKRRGALIAVNGGFFQTKTPKAVANDFLKIDGIVYSSAGGWGDAGMAVDDNGRLYFASWNALSEESVAWQNNYRNIMVAGPMLVKDGVVLFEQMPNQRHPRTVIGSKPDGTIVMAVIDGRREGVDGMTFWEEAKLAVLLEMDNCLNLDGGGSSSMWIRNKGTVNKPSDVSLFFHVPRKVANFLLVYPK